MRTILITLMVAGLLIGCDTQPQVVTTTRDVVVMPSESLFNCPVLNEWPDTTNLSDLDVARLIVQLYENNVRCDISIRSIREFLTRAREVTPPQ